MRSCSRSDAGVVATVRFGLAGAAGCTAAVGELETAHVAAARERDGRTQQRCRSQNVSAHSPVLPSAQTHPL